MILNKNIEIKITHNTLNYYKNKYPNIKNGDIIIINIYDLPKSSTILINVRCDVCGNEKRLKYGVYYKSYINGDLYCCSRKCANNKIITTNIKKYGVENVFQSEEIKERTKETCLEKYGVENVFQSKEIKEKIKLTMIEKYGVEHNMKLKETKEKIKKTCLVKYGIENPLNLEKSRKTMLDKYGVEYFSQSEEWLKKVHPNINKIDFKDYKNTSIRLTKRIKNKLYENWDGYDYYDKEYIKYNFNLDYNDVNYPTIDHKISIYYGFKNNISPEKISNIDNLCITKRCINSSKNKNNTYEIS